MKPAGQSSAMLGAFLAAIAESASLGRLIEFAAESG